MTPKPSSIVTAVELAERLGIHVKTLYRTRERMEHDDGLPRVLTRRGPLKWDRVAIDAWFSRSRSAVVAPTPAPAPDDDEAYRLAMEHYKRPT